LELIIMLTFSMNTFAHKITELSRFCGCCFVLVWLSLLSNNIYGASKPNVIIIMTDDMGYSDFGSYGSEIKTPNIDTLAYGGLRFTSFYNFSRCTPTRASLLTGLYPHQLGMGSNDHAMQKNSATIAEVLGENGYETAMVGKWHLSDRADKPSDCSSTVKWLNHQCGLGALFSTMETYPVNRGFDKHYGNLWALVDNWDPFALVDGEKSIENAPADWKTTHDSAYYFGDAMREKALEYIDGFSKNPDPFFMYYAFTIPHWPIQIHDRYVDKYKGVYSGGWDALRDSRYKKMIDMGLFDVANTKKPPLSSNEKWNGGKWEKKMEVHAGMIDYIDESVGALVNKLKEKNLYDNTIIFILSDNGASSEIPTWGAGFDRPGGTREGTSLKTSKDTPGDSREDFTGIGPSWASAVNTPFRWWKKESYEGGIATPLIVHWPKGMDVSKSAITKEAGFVGDIMPTILEAAGIKYPGEYKGNILAPLAGKSLMPLLKGKPRQGHDVIWFEHANGKALRKGHMKVVQKTSGNSWSLYDLSKDRTEMNDLAETQKSTMESMKLEWTALNDKYMADANITEPKLILVSPSKGDSVSINSQVDISWGTNAGWNAESGTATVKLEYNDGSSWNTLVESTPNDGSYEWNTPGVLKNNAGIRVSATIDGTLLTAENRFNLTSVSSSYSLLKMNIF
jgi:arylsulfatase A-like enzyme